jgi:CRP-like cAMP-binding protein
MTEHLTDRVALLRDVWLFSECTDDELERIAALAHVVEVPAGTVVVREGDPADEFSALVAGTAVVSTAEHGDVAELGAGSFFGEMALLDGGERTATVTAATALVLLVLHRDAFNEALALAMPALAPKLLTVVGRRMRALEAPGGGAIPFGA